MIAVHAPQAGAGSSGSSRNLRILHVIPSVAVGSGGPSKAMGQMERVLSGLGMDVVTATTDDDGPGRRLPVRTGAANVENGVTRHYFRLQARPYKISLPMLRWLRRNVAAFDVVHVHALFSFAPIVAAWIARDQGVPYVIRPLGVLNHYGMERRRSRLKACSLRLLEGPLLRDAAAVHFTARQEQEQAESLGVRMRARIVPLGIEPMAEESAGRFLAAHPGLGRRRLLFLSRIDRKKNIESLLQAMPQIRSAIPDVSLVICGEGDAAYVRGLKSLATSLGLADCIAWAGHVDGAMKASAFAAAELFVLPSYSENFGIAAVEALGVGLPCILGQGVAVAERVHAEDAGIAIAPTSEAVAAAVISLLAAPARLAQCGANARRLATQDYSLEAMGRGLQAMYVEASGFRRSAAQ
ncbi:MAG: glycosyltransferase [Pseudomonadota bacterium]|nr:glycosyltransferase [Pseudomonadota bacterium]